MWFRLCSPIKKVIHTPGLRIDSSYMPVNYNRIDVLGRAGGTLEKQKEKPGG